MRSKWARPHKPEGFVRSQPDPISREETMSGMRRFIGEEIEVVFEEKPGLPAAVIWRGNRYPVLEVLSTERRLDFSRPWWRRRHRDVYRVRVAGEVIFELHFHRGPGRRYWVLYTMEGSEST